MDPPFDNMMNAEINTETVDRLKKTYKIQYTGRIGNFIEPWGLDIEGERMFLSDFSGESCQLLILDKANGSLEMSLPVENRIRNLVYSTYHNAVIFTCMNQPDFYMLDVKSKKVERYNKEDHDGVHTYSVKVSGGNVYALDQRGHQLRIYDEKGGLTRTIDLKGIFEFPAQFSVSRVSNKILLSRVDDSYARLLPHFYKEYRTTDTDPGTNLAYYDMDKEKLEYLPGIVSSSPKNFWQNIAVDGNNNIFINNLDAIVKLDPDFKLIYRANILDRVFKTRGNMSFFYSSCIDGDDLYLLEWKNYRSIFKFSI